MKTSPQEMHKKVIKNQSCQHVSRTFFIMSWAPIFPVKEQFLSIRLVNYFFLYFPFQVEAAFISNDLSPATDGQLEVIREYEPCLLGGRLYSFRELCWRRSDVHWEVLNYVPLPEFCTYCAVTSLMVACVFLYPGCHTVLHKVICC